MPTSKLIGPKRFSSGAVPVAFANSLLYGKENWRCEMSTATVTSKGQVTIPVDVRKQLDLKSGDRIEFSFNEGTGRYEVYPVTRSLTALKGVVKKPAKPVSIEDMDQAIADQGASAR
jgi:antitoxin PrlF